MKIRMLGIVAIASLLAVVAANARAAEPLPRSTPEQQGVASAAVLDLVAALDSEINHVHGLMVLRNGHAIAQGWWEPYRPEFIHLLHSLSKSFTSTAIGLAISEGTLSLDDRVVSFFPDKVPDEPSWELEAMRIRDLPSMSTGQHGEDMGGISLQSDTSLVETFLHLPVAHKPGTHSVYNTAATFMCSAILQKVTGVKLLDYLHPRLLDPLGIDQATWTETPDGITHGGFGLSVTTESIARFGQLYLQEGVWEGRQLIPADWVRAATSRQTSNGSDPDGDWDQGYGYQFWRSRHDSYRGDGAMGQFALILPKQNSVIAINSGTSQMADIMNLVWDRLLPAMGDEPLAEDPEAHGRLRNRLESLSIPLPSSALNAGEHEKWLGRTCKLGENPLGVESLSLREEGDDSVLAISTSEGTHEIRSSSTRWVAGETELLLGATAAAGSKQENRIAVSGAWTAESVFSVHLAFTEAPRMATIELQFSDEGVAVELKSGTFGGGQIHKLVGEASDA